MNRLLPIIIVVSILGFFLVIAFVLLVTYCWRNRARRERSSMTSDDQGPPRQLTVRKGKVIPVSEIISTANASRLRASIFSPVGSGNRLKSKFWRTGFLPSTCDPTFKDRCRSSPPLDLEAQSESSDAMEEGVRILRQLEGQLRELKNPLHSRPAADGKSALASSREITKSLKNAYKAPPALETVTIEIPSTLGSWPTTIRTLVRKKTTSNAATAPSSKPEVGEQRSAEVAPAEKRGDERLTAPSSLRGIPADAIGLAISTNAIPLNPPDAPENGPVSLPRLSVIPRNSLEAFISADVSPTWTIANALAVPILSNVTPPPVARTAAQRPRSKYGRYPELSQEKTLPIVPRPA